MTHIKMPLALMEKILKQNGAERVGESGKERMATVVKDYCDRLSQQAAKVAKHAGRKTVFSADIEFAAKQLVGGFV